LKANFILQERKKALTPAAAHKHENIKTMRKVGVTTNLNSKHVH